MAVVNFGRPEQSVGVGVDGHLLRERMTCRCKKVVKMVMVFKIIAIIFFTIAMILSFIGLNELKKDNAKGR